MFLYIVLENVDHFEFWPPFFNFEPLCVVAEQGFSWMSSIIRVSNLICETLFYKTNKLVYIFMMYIYVIKRVVVDRPYNRWNDRSSEWWQSQFRQKWL